MSATISKVGSGLRQGVDHILENMQSIFFVVNEPIHILRGVGLQAKFCWKVSPNKQQVEKDYMLVCHLLLDSSHIPAFTYQ